MDRKRPPERRRLRLIINVALFVILAVIVFLHEWLDKAPDYKPIAYGKLKQILQAPGVTFRHLRVGTNDVRGEAVVRDRVAGADGRRRPRRSSSRPRGSASNSTPACTTS